jgi:hydroxymethylpyrimidine pyrophosphatase-like HAD family hydrolase
MRFRALACDYDGTLACHDRLGADVIAALERARKRGIKLILVTGRTFFELARVCERLDLFHVVVAENGGVLYMPGAAEIRDQGPPPPPRLLAALDQRGVACNAGRVVLGTTRDNEGAVLEALTSTGVRMHLVHNRAALMLLPLGISKGSGVRQAIHALGLSPHDVLALGDAENDLALFEACGWAACPENAVPELKERADWVLVGRNGSGIAPVLADSLQGGPLLAGDPARHRLVVGWTTNTAAPMSIPERGINVLIHGDHLSGKSWLAGLIVERLIDRRLSVCVIDPEGDYQILADLPGVRWTQVLERRHCDEALAWFERQPAAVAVLDFSVLGQSDKERLVERSLDMLRRHRRRAGRPHWIVVDEAHYFFGRPGADRSALLEERGVCLVTYKASLLPPWTCETVDMFLLARTSVADELGALAPWLPDVDAAAILPDLPSGEFLAVAARPAQGSGALTFVAAPRLTEHVRHLRKYAEGQLAPERRFFFRDRDGRLVATAESLRGFRDVLGTVDDAVLRDHAGRGDFSRWLRDVFANAPVSRQLAKIERRARATEMQELRPAIDRLITVAIGDSEEREECA